MKILLLGPERPRILSYLESLGDEVIRYEVKLNADSPVLEGVDFIVSYGYRHIIGEDVLRKFARRAINLHISYLPWNRGADPNLWSWLEDTPRGVSIHYIDVGLDTGRILAQRKVAFSEDATLRTSYDKLTAEMQDLFKEVWPNIREHTQESFTQADGGSFHKMRDKKEVKHLLHSGWDTPVRDILGKALPARA